VAHPAGTYRLGPGNANLSVQTGRGGAAAKAGHDLLIGVTSWEATLVLGSDASETSVELAADATSLRVIKGTGGMQALDEESIANIHQTIDDEVLKREDITFRSSSASGVDGRIAVTGDLTIVGRAEPIQFDLEVGDDGTLSASATVTQSDWGMKPYSALFGALKVSDDVEVILDGHL
jgi:polyisoprenoid-binding protein YceI